MISFDVVTMHEFHLISITYRFSGILSQTDFGVLTFVTSNGKVPYEEWFVSIRDMRAQALVLNRIDRVRLGNFGNCRSVGSGVYELKIFYGPGLRIYFGLEGDEIVVLLCGGDKGTQSRDISYAHELLKEFKKDAN